MVKICPKCRTKNFDDTKYCMKCSEKIKHIKPEPVTVFPSAPTTETDEFHGLQPKGYTPEPWQGRPYTKLASTCIGLYLLFFFIYSLFILLFIFAILTIVFGKFAISNGDKILGKLTFFVGIVLVVFTVFLLLLTLI